MYRAGGTFRKRSEVQEEKDEVEPMTLEEARAQGLLALERYQQFERDSQRGRHGLTGDDLRQVVQVVPEELNDAVELLEQEGLIDAAHYLGSAPYDFAGSPVGA